MGKSIRNRSATLLALAVLWISGAAGAAGAQWNFELLEVPRSVDWADFSLSRDGRHMGCVLDGSVWWWTARGGYRLLDEGDPSLGHVGMAADGSALAAARRGPAGPLPAVWYADGRRVDLGFLPADCPGEPLVDYRFDMSANGGAAVGLETDCAEERAFLWTAGGGLRSLQGEEGTGTKATAISADGLTVVGWSENPGDGVRRPALWRNGNGPHLILGKGRAGEATNVSLDGRVVVGQAILGGLSPQAFTWTEGAEAVSLGTLRGRPTDPSLALAVSDDGKVVGWSGDALWGEQEAFLWTSRRGMMSLEQLLLEQGVAVPDGIVLTSALDISGDGTTVVGVGRDGDWNTRFWRIRLGGSLESNPLAGSNPPRAWRPESARPDTLDRFRADFLHPFPFGKHRYAPFQ